MRDYPWQDFFLLEEKSTPLVRGYDPCLETEAPKANGMKTLVEKDKKEFQKVKEFGCKVKYTLFKAQVQS